MTPCRVRPDCPRPAKTGYSRLSSSALWQFMFCLPQVAVSGEGYKQFAPTLRRGAAIRESHATSPPFQGAT